MGYMDMTNGLVSEHMRFARIFAGVTAEWVMYRSVAAKLGNFTLM